MSNNNLPILTNEIELSCSKMSSYSLSSEHINGFYTNIARFINYESLIKSDNVNDKYIIIDCPIHDYTYYINTIISQYIIGLNIYTDLYDIVASAMALLINDNIIFNYYDELNISDKNTVLSNLDSLLRGDNVNKVELYIRSSDSNHILSDGKYIICSTDNSIPFWNQSQYKISAFN